MGAIVFKYFEGLQWVIHYYYSGVASWGWFYNYHYAPRISGMFFFVAALPILGSPTLEDLKGADEMSFVFELGKPFLPFQQLMGVMPAASKELIPETYRVGRTERYLVIVIHNGPWNRI
jgi:5'-3' exoribonuclease 1